MGRVPLTHTLARSAYPLLAATDAALAMGGPAARRARWLTKPSLMPCLAPTLLAADTADPAVRRTLAAQALCWGGDVALLGSGRRSFLAGLGCFLAGHVAYAAAFRSRSTSSLLATTTGRAALAAGGVLGPTMALAARRGDPRLAVPVATYGAVLSTMVAGSAAVPVEQGGERIVAGTTLFLLSDTLLAAGKFVLRERHPAVEAAVMATYTAAQWFIADGVARGTRHRHAA